LLKKALAFGLGSFVLALLVFYAQRVLIQNSRADIATLFLGFLSIAPVRLNVALTSLSETTRFLRVLPRWHRALASLRFLSSRLCVFFPR